MNDTAPEQVSRDQDSVTAPEACSSTEKERGILGRLGPGIISGAANDDPSAIVTFSMAGAGFGYATLWTSLFTLPMIAAVQLICARLGMVSGRGVAGLLRTHYPRSVLYPVCFFLAVANIVTIGADLGGMAEVTQMVTGLSSLIWTPIYAAVITGLLFYLPYRRIERIFRWLCVFLFAYVAAGLLAQPDWWAVLGSTFVPRVQWSSEYLAVIVAILGATISPYFVFWQAVQEVEEEYCRGRRTVAERQGATPEELEASDVDVAAGSFISKLITFFITLTTAATLFAHGKTDIASARDAAAALEPLAGPAASWLFAFGVIGTGMIAVPVLACSAAYTVAEAMRWRASLETKPRLAPKFYAVLLVSMLLGLALLYAGFSVVDMLFWASVLNGLLAFPSIVLAVLLTRDPRIMGKYANPGWLTALGSVTACIVGAAAVAMLVSFIP